MRRIIWHALAVLALLAVMLPASAAQKGKPKEPKRPKLSADADTNDANAYYLWGVSKLDRTPEDAAAAFYWSTRINPGWAEAFYARWVAEHLSDPRRFVFYFQDDKGTLGSPEVQRIDSLYLRALTLNPYLYRKFERIMQQHFVMQYVQQHSSGTLDMAELDNAIREYWAGTDPTVKAWSAYTQGNFPRALELFGTAMVGLKYRGPTHALRGQIFYMIGAYDSASAELTQAIEEMRKNDKNSLVVVYESKALFEQSLGMIQEQQGRPDSAREAYGRALAEDLSYAPAHVKLSAIDLAKGDTAGAISEMDIASQVQPSDGQIAFAYGYLLIQAGHDAEAMEQLKRATVLEPYYAMPRVLIAMIYDATEMKEEAVAAYNDFLHVASQRDPQLARSKERVAALSAAATTVPSLPPKP